MNPFSRLGVAALKNQPVMAARVLEDYNPDSVARFLAVEPAAAAAAVMRQFTPGFAASCLASMEAMASGRIFSRLPQEQQILVLRLLEHDRREALLQTQQPGLAAMLRRLLPYPAGTAGAIMEAPLARVPEELTVRQALKRVKRLQRGMKTYLYATGSRDQLTGVLSLHELITAPPASTVRQVMHQHVASLYATQAIPAVLNSPYWQDYHALPVTDEGGILVGVIRQKSLHRLQEQSTQEDGVSAGLNLLMDTGRLFSGVALPLLAALIEAGAPGAGRPPHD